MTGERLLLVPAAVLLLLLLSPVVSPVPGQGGGGDCGPVVRPSSTVGRVSLLAVGGSHLCRLVLRWVVLPQVKLRHCPSADAAAPGLERPRHWRGREAPWQHGGELLLLLLLLLLSGGRGKCGRLLWVSVPTRLESPRDDRSRGYQD